MGYSDTVDGRNPAPLGGCTVYLYTVDGLYHFNPNFRGLPHPQYNGYIMADYIWVKLYRKIFDLPFGIIKCGWLGRIKWRFTGVYCGYHQQYYNIL